MRTSPTRTRPVAERPRAARRHAPDPALLAGLLESAYARWHRPEEVDRDPLRFPRRHASRADREATGFVAAAFAFGRVAAFLPVLEALFARLGPEPAAAVAGLDRESAQALVEGLGYRFARPANVAGLLLGTGAVLTNAEGLQAPVATALRTGGTVTDGLRELAAAVRRGAGDLDPGFLVPREGRTGPMKRLHLFLRWMVRDDGIDLGAWPSIPASALVMPMDVHVCRIARLLGLIPDRRSGPGLRDALELTDALRQFDPVDPVRFDFALSHLGISGRCNGRPGPACLDCALEPACRRR